LGGGPPIKLGGKSAKKGGKKPAFFTKQRSHRVRRKGKREPGLKDQGSYPYAKRGCSPSTRLPQKVRLDKEDLRQH